MKKIQRKTSLPLCILRAICVSSHQDHLLSATGNGPIDAFFNAIRSIGITDYSFVSYSEHAVGSASRYPGSLLYPAENLWRKDRIRCGYGTTISVWLPSRVSSAPSTAPLLRKNNKPIESLNVSCYHAQEGRFPT